MCRWLHDARGSSPKKSTKHFADLIESPTSSPSQEGERSGMLGRSGSLGHSRRFCRRHLSNNHSIPKANLGKLAWAWSTLVAGSASLLAGVVIYGHREDRTVAFAESVVFKNRSGRLIDGKEIKKHNTRESCWVVVNGEVWDMTGFLAAHPGGAAAVVRVAGTDASKVFNPIHPSDTLREGLAQENYLGVLDPEGEELTISQPEAKQGVASPSEILPLSSLIELDDFERMAKVGLSQKAWSYYASTADDGLSHGQNRSSWSDILLRPRVLIDVTEVDLSAKLLGHDSSLPIYISPAALAKLAHEEGEVALCKGAHRSGIIQCISSNASCSLTDIHNAAEPDQTLFFQLYVNRDPAKYHALLAKLHTMPKIKAVYLTVDAPVGGKCVLDERYKASLTPDSTPSDSTSAIMFSGVSPSLTWDSIREIKSRLPTDMPLIIKGISTVEDAILAHQHGAAGIVLSNHGGRQLDSVPAPLLTLLEIRKYAPWLLLYHHHHPPPVPTRQITVLPDLRFTLTAESVGGPIS